MKNENRGRWINAIFRYLYGHRNTWIKNHDLALKSFFRSEILKVKEIEDLPSGGQMRSYIHYIRNEILPVNAGMVVRCENLAELPNSYKEGCFVLIANNRGYKATKNVDQINDHIRSLKSRIKAIEKNVESELMAVKALKRLKEEGWKDESE